MGKIEPLNLEQKQWHDHTSDEHNLPPIVEGGTNTTRTRICTRRVELRFALIELAKLPHPDVLDTLWNTIKDFVLFLGDVGTAEDLFEVTADVSDYLSIVSGHLSVAIRRESDLTLLGDFADRVLEVCDILETTSTRSWASIHLLAGLYGRLYADGMLLLRESFLRPEAPMEFRKAHSRNWDAMCARVVFWEEEKGRLEAAVDDVDSAKLLRARIAGLPEAPSTKLSTDSFTFNLHHVAGAPSHDGTINTSERTTTSLHPGTEAIIDTTEAEDPFSDIDWTGFSDEVLDNDHTALNAWVEPPTGMPISPAWDELNKLIGLGNVKRRIREIVDEIVFTKRHATKARRGTLHMMFTGRPGTGKTTVAKLVASILADLGILRKRKLVKATKESLIGTYVGESEKYTRQAIDQAMGGVLFIDEVHHLIGQKNGYNMGKDVISTLYPVMEDRKDDFVVIFATYSKYVDKFFDMDPGLRSRTPYTIDFEDYSDDDLAAVLDKILRDTEEYTMDPHDMSAVAKIIGLQRHGDAPFGNARAVRNAVDTAISRFNGRMVRETDVGTFKDDQGRWILSKRDFAFLRVVAEQAVSRSKASKGYSGKGKGKEE